MRCAMMALCSIGVTFALQVKMKAVLDREHLSAEELDSLKKLAADGS